MEDQVRQAIQIALDPASTAELKGQAHSFLGQLDQGDDGWKACANLFTWSKEQEIVRNVSLEIINNVIKSRPPQAPELMLLKISLFAYVQRVYGGASDVVEVDSPGLQNKLSQTFTYLFWSLYSDGWELFFTEFQDLAKPKQGSQLNINVPAFIFYLRVLSAVHDKVGDVLVPQTPAELQRGSELKDRIRKMDAQKIALTWQEILLQWRDVPEVVIEMCLKVVAHWAGWIDITLIANEGLLEPVFQIARSTGRVASQGVNRLRNTAIDTLTEIIAKKMNPANKLDLIKFMNLDVMIAEALASPQLLAIKSSSDYDVDMAEALARLVNTATSDIIKGLAVQTEKVATHAQADTLLHAFIPFVLRFISDESDDVGMAVMSSCSDLISFFRKESRSNGTLSPQHSNMLALILRATMLRLKHDETPWVNISDEVDEVDETETVDLRKRLELLQITIAGVDENMFIEAVKELIVTTFESYAIHGIEANQYDVNIALQEFYLFGQHLVKDRGIYPKGQKNSPASETVTNMMKMIMQSDISSFPYGVVQVQYMEICVRFHTFFELHPEFIAPLLENFVRLAHDDNSRVRARSWCLIHKIVKLFRVRLSEHTDLTKVIFGIRDLLSIRMEGPVPQDQEDIRSPEQLEWPSHKGFSSRLPLYEAAGCIYGTVPMSNENRMEYAMMTSNPVVQCLEDNITPAKDGCALARLHIQYAFMALGSLAKGFSERAAGAQSSTDDAICSKEMADYFEKIARGVLTGLVYLKVYPSIRAAARFAFSRYIVVLGSRIVPQLPGWIEALLWDNSSKDEMTALLRVLEQIIFGLKGEISEILDSLMVPLLQRVFAGLSEPTSGTDDSIQLVALQRQYLSFITVMFQNNQDASLKRAELVEPLISSLEVFARNHSDYNTAQKGFRMLIIMAYRWLSPNGTNSSAANGTDADNSNGSTRNDGGNLLPGLDQFIIAKATSACWLTIIDPKFRSERGRTKNNLLKEMATLHLRLYQNRNGELVDYLGNYLIGGLHLHQTVVDQFLEALQTRTGEDFKTSFIKFVEEHSNA